MGPAMPAVDSIEFFGILAARLDDGFAGRDAVFGAAGIDSGYWDALVTYWSKRLTADAGELASRFGAAYGDAKRRLLPPAVNSAASAEAALDQAAGLGQTLDVEWSAVRAAMPFAAPPAGGVLLPPAQHRPAPAELGATLPVGARLPIPALPFSSRDDAPSPGDGPRSSSRR